MFIQQQNILILLFLFLTLTQIEIGLCSNVNSYTKPSLKKTPAWIGSSMGRRLKRNPKDDLGPGTMYFNPNRDELNTLVELIQENPWSVFANVPEGQKRQMNFTPRLGRDAGEENIQFIPNSDRWLQESELALSSGDMSVRSPHFSPRLGRRIPNNYGFQFGRYA